MRRRRAPLLLTLLLAVAGLGGAALALAAPTPGDRIRASLPDPGAQTPRAGTVEFAGQDGSRAFNVAVVRSTRGAVLAYVCNGTSVGRWFTGTVVDGAADLTGPKGATLRAVFRAGKVTGTARIGRTRITFTLPRAARGSGLRRAVATSGGITFEAAWIVTNAGITRGIATDGKKTVATSSSSGNPAADDDAGVAPSTGTGASPPPDPTILNKFRCGRVVLKISAINHLIVVGQAGDPELDDLDALKEKFDALDCGRFFAV